MSSVIQRRLCFRGPKALGWWCWRTGHPLPSRDYIPIAVDWDTIAEQVVATFYIRQSHDDGAGWLPVLPGSERVLWATALDPTSAMPVDWSAIHVARRAEVNPILISRAQERYWRMLAKRDFADLPGDDSDVGPPKREIDSLKERVERERRRNAELDRQLRSLTRQQEQQAQELERLRNRSFFQRLKNA